MKKNLRSIVCLGFLVITLNATAQERKIKEDIGLTLDSLADFNEQSFRNLALERGISDEETKLFIDFSKRHFIKTKYNLDPPIDANILSKIATPACNNEDFEDFSFTYPVPYTASITTANGITGWLSTSTVVAGSVSSCGIPSTPSSSAPQAIRVIAPGPGGLTDALIGSTYPIHSVFGYFPNAGGLTMSGDSLKGEWFVKINEQTANSHLNRISKTVTITASNALFKFAFIAVIQGGHCCCDSPAFDLTFKDCSNNILPLGSYTVAPPSSSGCTPFGNCLSPAVTATFSSCPGNPAWKYNQWSVNSVDLSAYIGTCVTIEVSAVDCPYAGHAGYVYFDAQCGPSLSTSVASAKNYPTTFDLYPNPNNGDFTLNVGKNIKDGEILIQNTLGQTVFKQSISPGENKIQTKNLAQGVYYYSVMEDKAAVGKGKVVMSH